MCGLFGIFTKAGAGYPAGFVKDSVRLLALASESRGKDSSGIAIRNPRRREMFVLKGALPISGLLADRTFRERLDAELEESAGSGPFSLFGHARLVTHGSQLQDANNQPVIRDGIVSIHNGIIVNADDLWKRRPGLRRRFRIDTEILNADVRRRLRAGRPLERALSESVGEMTGTVSAVLFPDDRDEFAAFTNNGSLYVLENGRDLFCFASERRVLSEWEARFGKRAAVGACRISQVPAGSGFAFDEARFALRTFEAAGRDRTKVRRSERGARYRIDGRRAEGGADPNALILDMRTVRAGSRAAAESRLLRYDPAEIGGLRRCTRCILPETFPFIRFDEHGVCNYCANYRVKNAPKPLQAFLDVVEPYRSGNGRQDCIVPFSGGRDSTYTLHVVKKVLGLNPLAFTYDWGMVTDLARRNIARVCGRLGVENIIVAADIRKKRDYINRNISAWLRRPELGLVTLFMAGDKYFFKYTDELKRQTGIQLNIWGVNPLENTDFKVGFCGVAPDFEKERIYSLSMPRQLRLAAFFGMHYLENPRYFNASIGDTAGSFLSRYCFPRRHYFHLFDFMQWNEREIISLIRDEYDWEVSPDTRSTWRIGDGTAGFYNYIYRTVAGFSEIDTFRSNQIREGILTRPQALTLAEEENRPRYESIKWYLEIVGLDFEDTVRAINRIPKLYRRETGGNGRRHGRAAGSGGSGPGASAGNDSVKSAKIG
jgi:glutamine---fructose-6-phosphate transaminase (isomerizing)